MKIAHEQQTIEAMIGIYCRDHHHTRKELCVECQQLADYATARLRHCLFAPNKPTCKNCPVHCYRPEEKERIRQVMRYAGPRMLLHHPWMAVQHLWNDKVKSSH